MIRFEEVTRRYEAGGRPALDDVTVEFYRGDFAFLIGASGSGKSTLLRMILREGLPQRGKVTVAGQNLGLMLDRRVPDFRRSIGMVFQDFRLLPDKTVFDNVAFAMRVLGAKRGAIRKRVTKVLEKVELAHLAKRYPHEISGGEQQRAAIARAIVNDPAILLADEPTGNLDPRASAEVMKVLRWINASGTTVIMATHDRAIVDHAQTRVVQLHRGRLVRDEAHGFYDAPEGSEAWDVLAQEESESGLRAHDPAPLKTAVAPALGSAAADGAAEHDSFQDGEHHTWEPDTQDHHFVESRDESIDHVGDHPEDQVMAPGEDPSVLAFDEDPVLQETAESSPALRELDFDHHGGNDVHIDDAGAAQHEHPGMRDERHDAWPLDAPILDEPVLDEPTRDAPMSEAAILDEPFSEGPADESSRHRGVEGETEQEPDDEFHDAADTAPDVNEDESEFVPETGFSVTWPDHLREDVHGHDVPEPHGDFDGTELPDLDQDGFTEAEEEPELEEPLTGEIMPIPQAVETDLRHHDQDLDPDQDLDQDLDPDKFTDAEQDLGAEQDPDPEQYPDPDQDLRSDLGAEPDHANGDRSGSDQDSSRSGPQGPEPSGVPLTPATPAQPRPRLSWLAHAEEESPQRPDHRPAETQAPARPIFTLDPPSPRPPRAPESRLDPVPAEDPVLDGDPADGRDPVLEQDPGLEQDPVIAEDPELNQDPELSQGPERDHHLAQEQDPAPEQDLQSQDAAEHPAASESGPEVYPVPEERPVPKPMSSASQSTYTDARRTAEHLGIPRSRRSIMRRLRRDG
ncbi:cell division ATP-binding protein FtsE [Nesterenkonia jeotgali]|uniref:Cell division ATP-binding protein FtsE n=1 Tax=Nesterenkonia jeotgali TaxID=317018 RepID=A0A839FHK0_9MICC|nr:cell division ATP-binding protein FtsE [Nesterenkonia jeotgali]MBA8921180.1 cell division ATP-binding protein FtsE [Nesterenkonia jeotgali]